MATCGNCEQRHKGLDHTRTPNHARADGYTLRIRRTDEWTGKRGGFTNESVNNRINECPDQPPSGIATEERGNEEIHVKLNV